MHGIQTWIAHGFSELETRNQNKISANIMEE